MQQNDQHRWEPIDLTIHLEHIYHLCWRYADFHLFVISPTLRSCPARLILPEASSANSKNLEFVYPIVDAGDRFSTSKATEMYTAGMSMCKLYFTIEKIFALLIQRLEEHEIDLDQEEIQIAFSGHELAQRKGFEVSINMIQNIIVKNYEPGAWGDRYLKIMQEFVNRGYGYPAQAPRHTYRNFPDVHSNDRVG